MRVAELGANLAWQLEQVIGSDVTVALSGCTAKLRGRIPSDVARQAVLDITSEIAPWLNIVNELELAPGSREAFELNEDGEPFIPTMDPVARLDHRDRVHVIDEFALSWLDDFELEPSAHDISGGDEAVRW